MRTNFNNIVRDGIKYNQQQIKKLQSEIKEMRKWKTTASVTHAKEIDTILKWDQKLIRDFRFEIATLKQRLNKKK